MKRIIESSEEALADFKKLGEQTQPTISITLASDDRVIINGERLTRATYLDRYPLDISLAATVSTSTTALDELVLINTLHQGPVFLSGPAGSGKSHLLQRVAKLLRENMGESAVQITAPTGLAAYNINGTTLHSALGLGLFEEPIKEIWEKIGRHVDSYRQGQSKGFVKTAAFLINTKVLVIDEISMIHSELLDKLSELFQRAHHSTKPFGNTRVLFIGDFCQLGPISRSAASSSSAPTKRWTFQSRAWKMANVVSIYLQRNYRQTTDETFAKLLGNMREGFLSPEDLAVLESRVISKWDPKALSELQRRPIKPIFLSPYRRKVDFENISRLREAAIHSDARELETYWKSTLEAVAPGLDLTALVAQCVIPEAAIETKKPTIYTRPKSERITPTAKDLAVADELSKNLKKLEEVVPVFQLQFCVGSQVMCRINLPQHNIYNGTMGIVKTIQTDTVYVAWRLADGQDLVVDMQPVEFVVPATPAMNVIVRQYPFCLAYAATIHKCQGMTLDEAVIDAAKCFEGGQLYVVVSRLRSLEGLYLQELEHSSLFTDRAATDFQLSIEASSSSSSS